MLHLLIKFLRLLWTWVWEVQIVSLAQNYVISAKNVNPRFQKWRQSSQNGMMQGLQWNIRQGAFFIHKEISKMYAVFLSSVLYREAKSKAQQLCSVTDKNACVPLTSLHEKESPVNMGQCQPAPPILYPETFYSFLEVARLFCSSQSCFCYK